MDAEQTQTENIESGVFDTPPTIETPVASVPEVETEVVKIDTASNDDDDFIKYMNGEKDSPKKVEEEVAQVLPDKKFPTNRDYSGLQPDEVKIFKSMGNEAYAMLRPKYDDFKKVEARRTELDAREVALKGMEPKGVFDHEQAYTLSPQFAAKSQTVQQFAFEGDYWGKQFALIERGEDWKPLVIDNSGRFSEGEPKAATPEAKQHVLRNMTLATQYHTAAAQELKQVTDGYSERRNALGDGIRSYEKKFFPFFEDPNSPHHSSIKQILQAIPEEFRDHPMSSMLAKAMTTVKILNANNQELQKSLNSKQITASDKAKAGPSMSVVNNSAPSKPAQQAPSDPDKFMKWMHE